MKNNYIKYLVKWLRLLYGLLYTIFHTQYLAVLCCYHVNLFSRLSNRLQLVIHQLNKKSFTDLQDQTFVSLG